MSHSQPSRVSTSFRWGGVVGLPVEHDGVMTYSVTRHDLLRARLGLGVGMGIDP